MQPSAKQAKRTGLAVLKLAPRQTRDPLTRSQMMSRISRRDTKPELVARSLVTSLGKKYRIDVRNLPGAPDLANKKNRWAIFVQGCFWHQHANCRLASSPRSNSEYWIPKLARNCARDATNFRLLTDQGFRVFILWECECRTREIAMHRLRNFFGSS